MIVRELTRIQARFGYLPREELVALADRLSLPLYRIQEVVSFFPHFRTTPPDEIEILVCRDMACHLRGSLDLAKQLEQSAGNNTTPRVRVKTVSCLGRCDRAPAVRAVRSADHQTKSWLGRTADELKAWGAQLHATPAAFDALPDDSDAAYRAGDDPAHWRIDVYAAANAPPRYEAVRRYVAAGANTAAGDRIIAALETAGLLGMGGAGGRAYKKWAEVRQAVGERKYVVCNADESEPGTFKDRELLLRAPHLVIEGIILGGLVVGAERGYVYVRHEYEEQIAALEAEIAAASAAGVCGDNVLGTGRSFHVEVFVSPGGYICGEQTALIEAMEDKRAEPRNRPPELQTNGLWDMPTLLNNVETLAWAPAIVLNDNGRWYAAQGAAPTYRGARFFSISGDVAAPGVYEVPIGITLGELIERAGGMRDGQPLLAVALSGPSGGFLPARLTRDQFPAAVREVAGTDAAEIDVRAIPLDIALSRKMNLMLGAGIVIYAAGADLTNEALSALRFFQAETCGKCVPCRLGTTKLVEWCESLAANRDHGHATNVRDEWLARDSKLVELALTMRQTAICGLGAVAANPLVSLVSYFPPPDDR